LCTKISLRNLHSPFDSPSCIIASVSIAYEPSGGAPPKLGGAAGTALGTEPDDEAGGRGATGRWVHSWVTPHKPSAKAKGDSSPVQFLICGCFGALGCEPFGAFAAPPAACDPGYQPREGVFHCSPLGASRGAALNCGCSPESWWFRTTGLVHVAVELCLRLYGRCLRGSAVGELSPAVSGGSPLMRAGAKTPQGSPLMRAGAKAHPQNSGAAPFAHTSLVRRCSDVHMNPCS